MDYIYRELKKNELPKVMKLYEAVIKELGGKDYLRPFTQETYDTFFDVAINIGAFKGSKLVGMGRIRIKERDGIEEYRQALGVSEGRIAECSSYLVAPEYRRQGIMKKIQDLLFQRVKSLGFKYALAGVHPENTPSKKVLERYLKPIKTITNHYGSIRTIYLVEL